MKYAVGQAWSIKNIDESNARIVIGRIEPAAQLDGQIVIHCTIFDAVIADMGDGPEPLVFGHIPFTEEAFSASVETLLDSDARTADAFEEGYNQWAEALGGRLYRSGRGGAIRCHAGRARLAAEIESRPSNTERMTHPRIHRQAGVKSCEELPSGLPLRMLIKHAHKL